MFLIIQSLCFLFQVASLVVVLALSALAMPVYEEHQQIEEHHHVSTQKQHYTIRHGTQISVLKNCWPFVEHANDINKMPLADSASSATWRNILFITITASSVTHGIACHQDEGTDFDLNTCVKSSSYLGRPEWYMTRFIMFFRDEVQFLW